jgi:hypothetical protein
MKRIALVLVTLFSLSHQAAAQEADTDPRVLFQEGQAAYNGGDYDKALEKWQKAYELSGRSALLYNIAQAYSRLGRVTEEKAALEGFIAADTGPEELKASAEERLRSLEQRIARTGIHIEGDVAGAEVFVDGESVGSLPLSGKISIAPGRHRVTATAEGYVDAVSTVVVPAGETVSVELHFEPVEVEVVVRHKKKVSTAALALWAGGGAVLAGGAVLGGLALGKADGAVEGTSAASSARGMALGADIAIGVGAVAVVGGIIAQVVYKKKHKGEDAPSVSFSPTRTGAALLVRQDF